MSASRSAVPALNCQSARSESVHGDSFLLFSTPPGKPSTQLHAILLFYGFVFYTGIKPAPSLRTARGGWGLLFVFFRGSGKFLPAQRPFFAVSTLWNTTVPHLLDSRKRSNHAENGKMFHVFQKTRKTSVTVLKEIPRWPTILHEGCRSMKNCAGCRKDFWIQQNVLWNIAKFPQRILVNKAIANGFPDGYNTNRTQEMHQKCACLPCDMRMKENKNYENDFAS